jgi:hypothetical protein
MFASANSAEPEAPLRSRVIQIEDDSPAGSANQGEEAVVLLYKAAETASAQRTDEGVDTATRILENALGSEGYKVMQPDASTQAILDKGPRTIVTFAADAGLSVMLSAKRRELPIPGDPSRVQAEFSLNARVYCGSVMQPSPPEALGKITALRTSLGKGYEVAAKRAATQLADNLRSDLGRRDKACVGALERMIRDYQSSEPERVETAMASGPLQKPNKVWALLVGISDFAEARHKTGWEIGDLKGVRADMELMQRTLLERGVPPANILQLLDKTASASNFRQQLRTLQMKASRDDLILVYLSSHGMAADMRKATQEKPSLSGYGLPVFHDFNPSDANTIVDFWEIQSLLLNSRAQQVVWMVDTCHAGGAALGLQTAAVQRIRAEQDPQERVQLSSRGLQRIEPAAAVFNPQQVAQTASQVASGRHFIVLSAATPEQLALETGNGLFTASLAQGLKRNKSPVAIEQLFRDHIDRQVQEAASKRGHIQQPMLGKSGRGGEIQL